MRGLSFFVIILITWLGCVLQTDATPLTKHTKLSAHHIQMIRLARKILRKNMRRELSYHCRHSTPTQKALADTKGILSLSQRENRIIALQFRIARIHGYLHRLKKASKDAKFYKKMMNIGYIASDFAMNIGMFVTKNYFDLPWVSLLFPMSLKIAKKTITSKMTINTPQRLQLHIDREMDRIIQIIQFEKNPGIFENVVCYLRSSRLRNHLNGHCHPDHPFIRSQHKLLGQLWLKSQKKLHKAEHAWWIAPFTEFITHQELKNITNEQNFIILLSGLLQVQLRFLRKMQSVLINDYKAWGCRQLGPFFKS